MRRIPDIGSLDDFFAEDEDSPGARGARRRDEDAETRQRRPRQRRSEDDAETQQRQPRQRRPEPDVRAAVPGHDDSGSLDGLSIDELLALSDDSPPATDELGASRDDTGEWDAIEDMLDPSVMLGDTGKKG